MEDDKTYSGVKLAPDEGMFMEHTTMMNSVKIIMLFLKHKDLWEIWMHTLEGRVLGTTDINVMLGKELDHLLQDADKLDVPEEELDRLLDVYNKDPKKINLRLCLDYKKGKCRDTCRFLHGTLK